jgi:hypothetical protein
LEAFLLIGVARQRPFIIEDGYSKCWRGKDRRYYCCPGHADFGLEKALAAAERRRKVS